MPKHSPEQTEQTELKSTRGAGRAARRREPYPAVTADASGIVLSHNTQAAVLLPRVAAGVTLGEIAPTWLTEAHLRLSGGAGEELSARADGARDPSAWAEGRIGAYWVKALAAPGADGAVTWWLVVESTLASTPASAPASAARELAHERAGAGLLQELSCELLASLDIDRCTAMTARRAARDLADAAVVVGTGDGRTFPVTRCTTDGPVVQERVALDPGQLPGLAEALQGLPAVSSRWIDPREVPSWAVPEGFTGGLADIGSVAVVPLPGHGVPTGCLILLRHRRQTEFTPAEESFAQLFAARAGAALSVARSHTRQAHSTDVLIRDLLPPSLGRVHGICFSGGYRASVADELVGWSSRPSPMSRRGLPRRATTASTSRNAPSRSSTPSSATSPPPSTSTTPNCSRGSSGGRRTSWRPAASHRGACCPLWTRC
ncbi:GAF domain-containing protein [Streptomyces tauricus]